MATKHENEITAAFEAFLAEMPERPTGPMLEMLHAVFGYGYVDGFIAGARHARKPKEEES